MTKRGVRIYENGEITDEPEKLNVAMQKLKDDGHKVVYIMGGKMCSRAFRVTSVDWEMYISLMIYSMGRSSDASLIVQRLGRLCGLTPKRLICPQRVFASKDVFYKAIDCTNVTTEMVKTVDENPEARFGHVMTKIVLPKRETRVKLSKESIEKDWDIDSDKVPMHGIPKEAADEATDEVDTSSDVDLSGSLLKTDVNLLSSTENSNLEIICSIYSEAGYGGWISRLSIQREMEIQGLGTNDQVSSKFQKICTKSLNVVGVTGQGVYFRKRERSWFIRIVS